MPERLVFDNFQFQSTLPRGSDLLLAVSFGVPISYFNPRSLAGATYLQSLMYIECFYFNPRSLAGATRKTKIFIIGITNFNPRSLAGATKANDWAIRCVHISIHAPSRERPAEIDCNRLVARISIHAPSRERHRFTSS